MPIRDLSTTHTLLLEGFVPPARDAHRLPEAALCDFARDGFLRDVPVLDEVQLARLRAGIDALSLAAHDPRFVRELERPPAAGGGAQLRSRRGLLGDGRAAARGRAGDPGGGAARGTVLPAAAAR
jgi:hypothetical protein